MKRTVPAENYLDRIPVPRKELRWEKNEVEEIILFVKNTGAVNLIAQKVFDRPSVSNIRLDALGSFVWQNMSKKKSIFELGEIVHKRFGEKAEPLYERLIKFFQIMEEHKFIEWADIRGGL